MSEPTYRIAVCIDPHSEMNPWDAKVFRVSDGVYMTLTFGATREQAIERAQAWIKAEATKQPSVSVFATEDGELIEAA